MASVGVDLGGTKCLGVRVDDSGSVLAEHRVETPDGAEAVLDALTAVAGALVAPGEAVGVGAPGLVDRTGVLRFAPNLPGVVDLPVRAVLQRRLGTAVTVDNDATCAAWAERQLGAARDAYDAVLVTLGTGIGGGIVAGGVLQRGTNGFAGELGHMVVEPRGPACTCGKRGCWETMASGRGLGRLAREASVVGRLPRVVALAGGDPAAVLGEHVTAAAAEGDEEALALLREFGWWVALGLANLAEVLDPQLFVLGGGLVEAADLLLDPVREAFAGLVSGGTRRPPVRIVPAQLGEHAGAVGAALVAAGR